MLTHISQEMSIKLCQIAPNLLFFNLVLVNIIQPISGSTHLEAVQLKKHWITLMIKIKLFVRSHSNGYLSYSNK